MHANRVIVDRKSVECERQACSSRTTLARPCTIHNDQFWAVHCEPKCQAVSISLFIFFGLMCNFFWKPRGDQLRTFDEICDTQTTKTLPKRVTLTEEDFANVSTELACSTLWSSDGQRSRPGSFEASNFRFPTLKPKLGAGQRRKWRLVCEWVCTVASVSVQINLKRANCAKNNLRPKSGWLFLVNTRPFPEHSSSIATFSAGRAWLEATLTSPMRLKYNWNIRNSVNCVENFCD